MPVDGNLPHSWPTGYLRALIPKVFQRDALQAPITEAGQMRGNAPTLSKRLPPPGLLRILSFLPFASHHLLVTLLGFGHL